MVITYGCIYVGTLKYSVRKRPSLLLGQLNLELLNFSSERGQLMRADVFVLLAPLIHLVPHGVLVVAEEVGQVLMRIIRPLLLRAHRKQDYNC